jgi:hypothetical protein
MFSKVLVLMSVLSKISAIHQVGSVLDIMMP